jgi:pilus assembly protein CpaC
MKQLFYLFTLLVSLSMWMPNSHAADKAPKKFINLTAGLTYDEKIVFVPEDPVFKGDFKKVTKLSLSAETKTLRFEPMAEGIGTLTVMDGRGRVIYEYVITVKKSRLENVAREIKSLLGEIEGIVIKVINNKVVVDGEILLPRDMNRIMSVVSQYGEQASAIVTLSPIAQKKIAEIIEKDINNPEITCRAVNGKFILEGMANSKEEKDRAEVIALTYVPDYVVGAAEKTGDLKTQKAKPVINLVDIKAPGEAPPKKTIQLIVHYVELNKDYSRLFRFQFTPDIADGGNLQFQTGSRAPGGVISSITGTISNLLPKLNWAKEHGHARVLQSTSILVQEGQTGKIQSLTKIPYTTIGPQGQEQTNFADAGIISDITPTIPNANSDAINLSINFKLSALVGMTSAGPQISDNSLQTAVAVRSTQSAAIGGLVSNVSGTNYNKLPKNVGSNPLISLYSSKDFQKKQSQFVVFVTPVIKNSASAGSEKIKAKFRLHE